MKNSDNYNYDLNPVIVITGKDCGSDEGFEDYCYCGCNAYGDWCGQKEHIANHFGYDGNIDELYERWCAEYGISAES